MAHRRSNERSADGTAETRDKAPEAHDPGSPPGYVRYILRRAQIASFKHLDRTAGALERA